jgi:hypothetical protein
MPLHQRHLLFIKSTFAQTGNIFLQLFHLIFICVAQLCKTRPELLHHVFLSLFSAGVAGNQCKTQYGSTVSKITGQDPAGPLYFYLNATYSIAPAYQLVSSDATWVDVYHTGRGLTLLGISPQLGFGTVGTSVGNMDVFINGGNGQPGCLNQTSPLSMAYCDHIYSWQFYIDTMTSPSNTYGSCPCTTGTLQGSTCLYNPGCLLSLCNLFKPPNCSVKSATGYNAVSG